MSVAFPVTKTLVVNGAFLQEIKDSNPDLWSTVDRLGRLCTRELDNAELLRQLTRTLDDLRDRLATQFSLEESYGYVEVFDREPTDHSNAVGSAQAEHGILYLQLSDLAEAAEELQYRGIESEQLTRLIERSVQFEQALQRHEANEQDLIAQSRGMK